jgi:hypothetical protein
VPCCWAKGADADTAALRGPAATDPDTPARSAAGCDRRPAAAPQREGFYGRRTVPLPTTSTSPDPSGKANDGPPGFRSPAGAGCVSTTGDRGDRIGAILSDRQSTRIAGLNLTIVPSLVANHYPMREADHVYKDRPGRFGEPGDARGRRTLACHNCLHLRDRFWDPRLSGAGATVLAADPHLGTGKADPRPSNSAHWQGRRRLTPLGPAHHHINLPASAAGTDEPFAPTEHGRFGAEPSSHLGGIGLDLMLAGLAPNDQSDAGGGSVAERHRWAGGISPGSARRIALMQR